MPDRALPTWPRALSLDLAASYCSLSATAFEGLVRAGEAPKPIPMPIKRRLWLREDIDAWLDRRAGRASSSGTINPWDAADGISAPALR